MEQTGQTRYAIDRRRFLAYGAVAAAAALSPVRGYATAPSAGAVSRAKTPVRTLSFFHTHTGERLKATYCCDGKYEPDALKAIDVLLRDFRVDKVKQIDPKLLDLLHELSGTLETDQPFHVISGYRAPETNQMLRARGGAHTGVASQSMHMVGKAIDLRLPGVKLHDVREVARVDTGRVRYW